MPPNVSLVAPEGELDVATLDDSRAALSDAASRPADAVVVDLGDVSFIDSSSLGAVIEAGDRLRRDRRRLAVVAPPGSGRRRPGAHRRARPAADLRDARRGPRRLIAARPGTLGPRA
jgi:anti-anti-sigma factor